MDKSGRPKQQPFSYRAAVSAYQSWIYAAASINAQAVASVPLRLYVDSFRQKIERNAALIQMRLSGEPAQSSPLVSVAVRSDGSVDDVTIVRSSGRADTDEAVRSIVRLNARYAAFPPNVAARFDVIEIRRIWRFAENLKLLEEVR